MEDVGGGYCGAFEDGPKGTTQGPSTTNTNDIVDK